MLRVNKVRSRAALLAEPRPSQSDRFACDHADLPSMSDAVDRICKSVEVAGVVGRAFSLIPDWILHESEQVASHLTKTLRQLR